MVGWSINPIKMEIKMYLLITKYIFYLTIKEPCIFAKTNNNNIMLVYSALGFCLYNNGLFGVRCSKGIHAMVLTRSCEF